MFRLIIISLLIMGSSYVGWRLTAAFAGSLRAKLWIWGCLVAFIVTQLAWSMFLRREGIRMQDFGPSLIAGIGFFALGMFAILTAFVLVSDLVLLLARLFPKYGETSLERRESFRQGLSWLTIGGAALLSGVGYVQARVKPGLKEVDVPVPNLPESLEGFKIIQITDLHVGQLIRRDFVEKVVAIANSTQPDLVALTGDFLDGDVVDLRPEFEPLTRLKSKHGSMFVPGNHEYYWGINEWCEEFRRMGARVLLNEHHLIEHGSGRLLVTGLTDFAAGRMSGTPMPDAVAAMQGAPAADFYLMLVHQPKGVYQAEKIRADLQLSGHTHSGQFFPASLVNGFFHPYHKGLNRHARPDGKDMWVYVNPGTGFWGPPNRLGVPSEITLLRLRKA